MGYANVNLCGLFCIVPATILLTVSYFVLLMQSKAGNKTLKRFGRFVLAFLWLSAAIVLCTGLYLTFSGKSVFQLTGGKRYWKAHHPWMQDGHRFQGCPRTFAAPEEEMMADPHHGMMRYHDYDAQGNIILDDSKEEVPVKK